jgi:hypothetical protein
MSKIDEPALEKNHILYQRLKNKKKYRNEGLSNAKTPHKEGHQKKTSYATG